MTKMRVYFNLLCKAVMYYDENRLRNHIKIFHYKNSIWYTGMLISP